MSRDPQKHLLARLHGDLRSALSGDLVAAVAVGGELDDAGLRAGARQPGQQALATQRSIRTYDEFVLELSSIWVGNLRWLLGHVEQDQAPVFVGDGGADPHVTQNGRHHARRKFLRSGVTAAAIGAKALLTCDAHAVGIGQVHDRRRR